MDNLSAVIALHSTTIVLAKVSKVIAGVHQPLPSRVLLLHEELSAIEAGTLDGEGDEYKIVRIVLAYGFVKLHRNCVGSGLLVDMSEDAAWHREVSLRYSSESPTHLQRAGTDHRPQTFSSTRLTPSKD